MRISGKFKIEVHEEYGELGLRLSARPWFEPLGGLAAAHDLMEHFADDDGTLAGELQALGASLFVRDCGSYFAQTGSRHTDASVHIAADMVQQVHYTRERGENELPPIRTRALSDDYVEGEFQRSLAGAIRTLREEFEGEPLPGWLKTHEQRARFVGWLRRGYRRAVKRYSKFSADEVCAAFIAAEKAADSYLRDAFEGDEVRLTIDLDRASASIVSLIHEDY